MKTQQPEHKVIIVGAGLSGICMGITLKKMGIDFVILEKNDAAGGTWFNNLYPGCGCDIPMFAYCYSFEKFEGDAWPKQPEILAYLKDCVRQYNIEENIVFNASAQQAKFDEHRGQWTVTLAEGKQFTAQFLINATGQLNRLNYPKITGIEQFQNTVCHSAEWDSGIATAGKKIGIVGNGATALQLVEALQPVAEQVCVFARSAKYVFPRVNYSPMTINKMHSDEHFWRETRARFSVAQDEYRKLLDEYPKVDPFDEQSEMKQLYAQSNINDWDEFDAFYTWLEGQNMRPDYPTGCSRPLASNTYHKAIREANVTVYNGHIDQFDEQGVVINGNHQALDLVIMATGFDLNNLIPPYEIVGAAEQRLSDSWADSPEAYLGLATAGFPNLFFLYGPNTNTNSSSVTFFVESQVEYIKQMLESQQKRDFRLITVKPDVQKGYMQYMLDKCQQATESADCSSWYKNDNNINISTFPGGYQEYKALTETFRAEDYSIVYTAASSQLNKATDVSKVIEDVVEIFSTTTGLAVREVNAGKPLRDYAMDSILITDFIKRVNNHYQLNLDAAVFFEYPDLSSFCSSLAEMLPEALPLSKTAHVSDESSHQTPVLPSLSHTQIKMLKAANQSIEVNQHRPNQPNTLIDSHEPIAVIGAHGYFPQANNLEELWDNLASERDCIAEVPLDRWDWQAYFGNPADGNKTRVKWGGFIDGVDQFDPLFFQISPREAELMDPQHRLFLQCCWELVELAGYNPNALTDQRVGVILGINLNDYAELVQQQASRNDTLQMSGLMHLFGANRISYLFGFTGPSEVIDTACSSSLVAIHRGIQSLRQGDCDMVIAGGSNLMLSPKMHLLYSKAGMLAVDGRCKTFSAEANGYARGEGVAAVLLKGLSAAEKDGDMIMGLIRGSSENHGGKASSLTAPNPILQARLVEDAITQADIDPRTIGLIECHGTGTALGDPIEFNGLRMAFDKLYQKYGVDFIGAHCGLGSIKSNIGHLETTAGVAGLIKILLCFKHKQIPATINHSPLNEQIHLNDTPFYIVEKSQAWNPITLNGTRYPRRAGVSSFGAGGTNAHVILEEYAPKIDNPQAHAVDSPHLFPVSAKSQLQLQQKVEDLYTHLLQQISQGISEHSYLTSVAYTLQLGREEMEHRFCVVADSMAALISHLKSFIENPVETSEIHTGNVITGGDLVHMFSDDDDLQMTVKRWMAGEKLNSLAKLWVKGLSLDWKQLHANRTPLRVQLPTHPFNKQRHWFNGDHGSELFSGTGQLLHPLVHQNISDFSRQAYATDFLGTEFFLRDHKVRPEKNAPQSIRILPAVVYLEMVTQAFHQATGEPGGSTVEFSQVAWIQPLIVEEQQKAIVSFDENEHQEMTFTVASLVDDQEVVHCQGLISETEVQGSSTHDLAALQQSTHTDQLHDQDIYQGLFDMGLDYGPTHRSLKAIYLDHQQLLAHLAIPDILEVKQWDFALHPSLLDGVLQACNALITDLRQPTSAPSLPFALESLAVLKQCDTEIFAFIRRAESGQGRSGLDKMDIDIINPNGEVALVIKGLTVRQASKLDLSSKNATGRLYASPHWSHLPLSSVTPVNGMGH
ncbi:beta-ketoacyl synthase N-terminal-like domain-containing protein, partial [Marinicella sediminis]